MIPSVLARQLQRGMEDYFRTTFPFVNEPFKSSFDRFATNGKGLYLEPYTVIRLPFRTADAMPSCCGRVASSNSGTRGADACWGVRIATMHCAPTRKKTGFDPVLVWACEID